MIVVVARLLMLEFEMQLQHMVPNEGVIISLQPGAKAAAKTTDHLAAAELLPPLIVAVVESCLLT